MKYLKRFNESDMMWQIWNQFMDSITECFLEFEDTGWYWSSGSEHPNAPKRFSLDWPPEFNCIMLKEEDDYEHIPTELRDYIDMTGDINSDGEINWITEKMDFNDETLVKERNRIKEESDNFVTAIKRLQGETGNDFRFSYNNKGGDWKIIIQGRV